MGAKYLLPLALCAVVWGAGCAPDSGDSPVTVVSSVPGSTAVVPPTPVPGGDAAVRPCVSGQVAVAATEISPGSTHRGVRLGFSVVRPGERCTLRGYPGVDSGAGGPLLHATWTERGYLGGLAPGAQIATVTLDAAHGAHAVVEGRATDDAGNQCPFYTELLVTPPNTTDSVRVPARIDTCELTAHPVVGDDSP
ncbi:MULTISPECIES: DUF4232 domain-containing protein [unclassified Nocardia]|uniref:DUF4232 domain-containing protein n=1 Tax=unclassified Nocardia TaxID=2637762 RepID=UPI001CE48A90|nr:MULTISPECIES: DUF4232 domain-containing protein [unclassified Nocardia]